MPIVPSRHFVSKMDNCEWGYQKRYLGLVETILKFRNIKNAPFLKGLHSDAQLKYVLHSDTHKPSLAILAQVQTAKY